MSRDRPVAGVKKMVALVEDETPQATGRCFLFLGDGDAQRLVDGSLVEDQGMGGDDEIGAPCITRGALDEAALEMRTGGIDAFAAPVGDAKRGGRHAARFA